VRREEARRFRSGEADILVATDAIALGLNLPIRTVLFYSVTKWNGREQVPISNNEIRQIGGRAGRYGKADLGFVGAFSRGNLRRIEVALAAPPDDPPVRVQVRPSLSHVLAIGETVKTSRLAPLLDLFQKRVRFDDPLLTTADLEEMLALAELTDQYPLSLEDKFTFSCVPLDTRSEAMVSRYKRWLKNFSRGLPSPVEPRMLSASGALDQDELYQAEVEVKLLTAYAWLAYRYAEAFPDIEGCEEARQVLNELIEKTLRQRGIARRCQSCGAPLAPLHRFSICDRCFHNN
jgi:ATP-dependent RNA helicase SUPV3L1/SUV3